MSARLTRYCLLVFALLIAEMSVAEATRESPGLFIYESRTRGADFAGRDGAELSAAARGIRLDVVRRESDKDRIDVGVDYEYTRYEYRDVPSRNRDLHRVQVPIRFQRHGDDYRLNAFVAPGIATSSNVIKDLFRRGTNEDYFVTGGIEYQYFTRVGALIVGAAFDRRFGDDRLYPIAGFAAEPSDALSVRLAYPTSELTYARSERQTFELSVFPAGQLWHVRTDDFSDEFDYEMQAWRAQLRVTQLLWDRISIDVAGGYEFDRQHRFEDVNGEPVSGDVADAWFFVIGFHYAFEP